MQAHQYMLPERAETGVERGGPDSLLYMNSAHRKQDRSPDTPSARVLGSVPELPLPPERSRRILRVVPCLR